MSKIKYGKSEWDGPGSVKWMRWKWVMKWMSWTLVHEMNRWALVYQMNKIKVTRQICNSNIIWVILFLKTPFLSFLIFSYYTWITILISLSVIFLSKLMVDFLVGEPQLVSFSCFIVSFDKTGFKKSWAFIHLMKFLSSKVAPYLYKSTIWPCMEFYWHICAGWGSQILLGFVG